MVLNALFYVLLLAVLTFAVLGTGLNAARIAVREHAKSAFAAGFARADAVLIQTVGAQLRSSGSVSPLPSFTPLPAECTDGACTGTLSETIAVTQIAAPSPVPSCDPAVSQCATNVQTNPFVNESRIAARITVTLAAANGAAIATRSAGVIVRTMQTPPYAAIAGSLGDDGGAAPATPNPCAAWVAGSSADTQVRVQYRNIAGAGCSDASSWSAASYSSVPDSPAGWSP